MGNACTRRNALHCPREAKDVDAPALATQTPVTSAEDAQKARIPATGLASSHDSHDACVCCLQVSRADCHDGHDEIIGFDGSSNTPNQELFKPAKALQYAPWTHEPAVRQLASGPRTTGSSLMPLAGING